MLRIPDGKTTIGDDLKKLNKVRRRTMEWGLFEKEKAKKIDSLLERYGRIQRKRAWHKRSRTGKLK